MRHAFIDTKSSVQEFQQSSIKYCVGHIIHGVNVLISISLIRPSILALIAVPRKMDLIATPATKCESHFSENYCSHDNKFDGLVNMKQKTS